MSNFPVVKTPCPDAGLPSDEGTGEKRMLKVVYWSPTHSPEVRQMLNKRTREARKFGPVIMTGVQHPDMLRADEEKE
ncbi:hypothetical protein ACFH4J_003464 [Escherichia coli]